MATYLPHGLYVKAPDEMQAREILDLPPGEIAEREGEPPSPPRKVNPAVLALIVIAAIALLVNLRMGLLWSGATWSIGGS